MGTRKSALQTTPDVGEDDLLEELAQQLEDAKPRPGEITVKMLMTKTGRTRNSCRDLLDNAVSRGELIRRVAGRNVFYSRK